MTGNLVRLESFVKPSCQDVTMHYHWKEDNQRISGSMEHADDHSSGTPNKIQVVIWGALLVVAVILSLNDYQSFQLGTYRDDAFYTVLAQSLVHSDQYGLINVPGEQPGAAPFPFGYPLLLTPFVLLFPDSLDAMKILSLLATLLNATLLFWGWCWFSRRSYWWGIAVVGLYILSPLTVNHTRMVMSESVFTTFCLVAMLLTEEAARGEQNRWWSLLMSVALTFVTFTRTVGLVLVITVFAYLLFRVGKRVWKELILIGLMMILLVGVVVGMTPVQVSSLLPLRYLRERNASFLIGLGAGITSADPSDLLPSKYLKAKTLTGKERLDNETLLVDFLKATKRHLGEDLRQAVLPFGGGARERAFAERLGIPSLPILVGFLTFGLIALGYFRWFAKEGLSVFNLFAILYFGALLLWNWIGPRLLYPIQPQLHLGFLLGLEAILVGITSVGNRDTLLKFGKVMLASAFLVLWLLSVRKSLEIADSRLHVGDLKARTKWLKANTNPSDIIVTEQPPLDFLYSNRRTIYQPDSLVSATELEDYLVKHEVDYILIAPQLQWQPSYVPSYSDRTIRFLLLITDLVSESRITRVYSSERDLVEVFKVKSQE